MLDEKMIFFYSGITAIFQVTIVSCRSDIHPKVSENKYYGFLDDIFECDFKSFKLVMLTSNGTFYECMNMILIELLITILMDLPWLIQGMFR
jgi:hypothetical protein